MNNDGRFTSVPLRSLGFEDIDPVPVEWGWGLKILFCTM
jgi:hypothetical protein